MRSDKFLCPQCEYGYRIRIVKDKNGVPHDVEYSCVHCPPGILDYIRNQKTGEVEMYDCLTYKQKAIETIFLASGT
jgi:hypothetical protein